MMAPPENQFAKRELGVFSSGDRGEERAAVKRSPSSSSRADPWTRPPERNHSPGEAHPTRNLKDEKS